jgi:hypothetical protein
MPDDCYHVTDGRNEREFPYTVAGLREAWEYARSLPWHGNISNPNRTDLDDHGLTQDEKDTLDMFEAGAIEQAKQEAPPRQYTKLAARDVRTGDVIVMNGTGRGLHVHRICTVSNTGRIAFLEQGPRILQYDPWQDVWILEREPK